MSLLSLQESKHVFFFGIGGIGMSALARWFLHSGKKVSGFDRNRSPLTETLMCEGAAILFSDDVSELPENVDLVIYTPAIPFSHRGIQHFLKNNTPILKRSEALGHISAKHFTIAVAGSHGKTSVTTLLAHILHDSGYGCNAFLGGISVNYNTNFLPSVNDVMLVEADEFDRSFHRLLPDIAVITSVDTDHLDIYGSKDAIDDAFVTFAELLPDENRLFIKKDQSIESRIETLKPFTYSLDDTAQIHAVNLRVVNEGFTFDLITKNEIVQGFSLPGGGRHNVENAVVAIAVALQLGIESSLIKNALSSFLGVKRRFETILKNNKYWFVDDYAHHPEEIRTFLTSIKEMAGNKRVTAIFQPHLFSRTRDLAEEFAQALSIADNIILLPIYPAREEPIIGVSSELILNNISPSSKHLCSKEELIKTLSNSDLNGVVCTIGAGDIDELIPAIKRLLNNN